MEILEIIQFNKECIELEIKYRDTTDITQRRSINGKIYDLLAHNIELYRRLDDNRRFKRIKRKPFLIKETEKKEIVYGKRFGLDLWNKTKTDEELVEFGADIWKNRNIQL